MRTSLGVQNQRRKTKRVTFFLFPLSLTLSLSPSPSLAVSLFPMAGACDIRRIARPRRVLSVARLDHQFQTIAWQSVEKERVISKNRGMEISFFDLCFSFESKWNHDAEDRKKEGKTPFVFLVARERSTFGRFPRSLSDVFYTCFRGINEVFPASTKFRWFTGQPME